MIITGLVFAALAALVHVYIFYMESIAWTTPRVRNTFGVSEADAETTKGLALNQGFYNLFLAIVTGVGVVFFAVGNTPVGAALVISGIGSMFLASIVLVLSDGTKRAAALKQGLIPLLSLLALIIGLLS